MLERDERYTILTVCIRIFLREETEFREYKDEPLLQVSKNDSCILKKNTQEFKVVRD